MRFARAVVGVSSSLVFCILLINSQMQNPGVSFEDIEAYSALEHQSTSHKTPDEIIAKRLIKMRSMCEILNEGKQGNQTLRPSDYDFLIVNDDLKLMYCEVPKVACTNWKRILLVLSGQMNTSNPNALEASDVHNQLQKTYLKRLSEYSTTEINERLNTYYKFMFVRDPFERLLSAYKNKFTLPYNKYFHKRYGRQIIKRFRKNATLESMSTGSDVTFEEFIQYIIHPSTRKSGDFNPHWRGYINLCHPCQLEYNFIGKFETLHGDTEAVLHKMNISERMHFPAKPSLLRTADSLANSFSNISQQDIHALWKIYSEDYLLFDYSYPDLKRS